MKKQQELQESELRMELKIKEAAVGLLKKSDLKMDWVFEEMNLKMKFKHQSLLN